ncbi:MAG: ABC transporter permease [Gammaproteobacteria bacterium]|nr:ABC transporter permease [Gammaproteobacteria bacterium]
MLLQSVKKEAILICNDLHSVGVLLLLPISFMLIMTFAMSEQYSNLASKMTIKLVGQSHSAHGAALSRYVSGHGFKVVTERAITEIDATIEIKDGFDRALLLRSGGGHIELTLADKLSPQAQTLIKESIKVSLSKLKLHAYMDDLGDFEASMSLDEKVSLVNASADVDYLIVHHETKAVLKAPTLYSVPSWMVFGIYFIVLPISITLINEKQNGTLIRIKTYPISTSRYFSNKALSYGVLSLLQWLTLSVVGLMLVPLITGQPMLGIDNIPLYICAGLMVVFSAIGFAFLIASMVSTYDQAIVLGGGINILMAALSGFMVPVDIMPQQLADLASFSPMYWSGDVIRQAIAGATMIDGAKNLLALGLFGLISFAIALVIFNVKSRKLLWN